MKPILIKPSLVSLQVIVRAFLAQIELPRDIRTAVMVTPAADKPAELYATDPSFNFNLVMFEQVEVAVFHGSGEHHVKCFYINGKVTFRWLQKQVEQRARKLLKEVDAWQRKVA